MTFIGGYDAPGYYMNPGLPYVLTTPISGTSEGMTVLSASAGNYLSYLLFDYVTVSLTLTNTELTGSGASIKLGFTEPGIGALNYFTLSPQQSLSLPVRTPVLYMSSSANANLEILATVSSARMPNIRTAIDFISGTGV
jgi:hypothetical protein